MKISCFKCGLLEENCYLIETEKTAIIVDPGFYNSELNEWLVDNKSKVKAILLTHFHADHISNLANVESLTGAPVYIHKMDCQNIFNPEYNLSARMEHAYHVEKTEKEPIPVSDGDVLKIGDMKFQVIHTPGHTNGSACYLADNNLFSGDTLFYLSYGRTDLITGSFIDLKKSLNKLFLLPESTKVYPGHGDQTSIALEKTNNPIKAY